MARRPYITPPDVPTARISRCLSFPDSLEWEALVNGFLAMGTRIENWQQLSGGIEPEEAVAACVELLNEFFEAGECAVSPIVGEGKMWFTDTPPDRWLLLDGTPASRAEYPELFALWGTQYGAGDGSTTFDIPNLIGRSPIGAGFVIAPPMSIGLGAAFGEYEHTLTIAEMPEHRHRVPKQSVTVNAAVNVATPAARTDNPATPHVETDLAGGGLPHNNVHPVWGVNFIVYAGES